MATAVEPFLNTHATATALTVFNLPQAAGEQDIRSIFPSVKHVSMTNRQSDTGGSQGMCILHFDNPRECQKVYAECQSGKTVGGRMLHAEFSSSFKASGTEIPSAYQTTDTSRRSKPKSSTAYDDYQYSDNSQYYSTPPATEPSKYSQGAQRSHGSFDNENSSRRQSDSDSHSRYQQSGRYEQPKQGYSATTVPQSYQQPKQYSSGSGSGSSGCTLTVSNLPYSATEADIKREFVDAFRVILTLNEQGQSRGVAQVTFSTPEQCNAALYACNQKTMNGRTLRGRIQRDNESGPPQYGQRDSGGRDHSSGRRDFGNNQRSFGDGQRDNSSRGDYGGMQRGNYGNNQRDYGGNRDFGARGSGGNNQHRDFGGRRGGSSERGGRLNDYNSGRNDRDNRFSGGNGAGNNRYGQRDSHDDMDNRRRDRSPNRGEPVRGYGGGKGPRITSAVIRGQEASSSSASSSDEN